MSSETLKGAQMLVEYLVREKVRYAFGVCGHGIIGFLDALYDRQDAIHTITAHDEQAAGFMADAYYRVTHTPAVTYTSSGPGSLNQAMAVANAFYDSSAFLAVTGNVPTQQFNRGPFQESGRFFQGDFNNVMRPYVKRTYQAFRPEMIPLIARQSFGLMTTGRPGPVHIDVPLNVFVEEAEVDIPDPVAWRQGVSDRSGGEPAVIARAAALLVEAERPVVLGGNGVFLSEALTEFKELSTLLGIPVITSPLGKGAVDESLPLNLGPTGRNGPYAANRAARESDVLLALGTRFDDRPTSSWAPGVTYSIPPTRLIHVDIDPQEIGRNYPVEIGIVGDVRTVLRQLIEAVRPRAEEARNRHAQWRTAAEGWKASWERALAPRRTVEGTPLHPSRLVADLGALLPDDSIVLADVGIHHNWLVQQLVVPPRGRLLQAWGFAAMGFGVAGAIGAKFGAPDRPVVAVCGDGGFLMTANAVATATEYDLPVVWVVWNNSGYGSIYGQQATFFGPDREIATRFRREETGELISADFAMLGRAMGADGYTATTPSQFKEALSAALAGGRPAVIDVAVDESQSAPSTGSWDLPPLSGPAPTFTPDSLA
ncbi:MAG: acetolactate synthase large subunit [Chloroflexota bacterium]|nr:acetolactate synthase large subunit [Chloroflexota bacterium]